MIKKSTQIKSLCLALSIICFFGSCDPSEEMVNVLEEVQYEMSDDHMVTVILDPNFTHQSYTFASLEEHDQYLNDLEERNEPLVVNKKMYNDLSHYFDPYQLLVLDMDYTVRVGDDTFKATPEAAYKKNTDTNSWDLHIYYGLSGTVDLEETSLIYENINDLKKLEDYEFKSPISKELYIKKSTVDLKPEGKDYRYFYHRDGNGTIKTLLYRNYPTGEVLQANIRWFCWNEEYRSWGGKAKGGTVTEINRLVGGIQSSWTSMPSGSKIGAYHANGIADTSVPYVYVKVQTSKGSKTGSANNWSVSKSGLKRKNGKSAWSYHRTKVRENNFNISVDSIIDERVD